MRFLNKLLITSAGCALILGAASAHAETVTTKTIVHTKELDNAQKIDFSALDMNGDSILSMKEVGEKLFYIFDADGNEVIDNIEFDHKNVMTIIPMEKEIFTFVDWDNDGSTDQATYTYETFIDQSGLMRFDENHNGLSPADFMEMSFLELDDNKSKAIELDEWKEEYMVKVKPAAAEQERYN